MWSCAFNIFYPWGSAPPRWEICFKKCDRDPHPKPYIFMIRVTRQIKCIIAQAPGSYPTPRPYIFMIRVTRQIKCLISQAPGDHTPPLSEVNFIMVEIPTPKPYIFMIRVNKQIKCPKNWDPGSSPSPTWSFLRIKHISETILSILTKFCPNVPWMILFQRYVRIPTLMPV